MTKKHFIALANTLRNNRPLAISETGKAHLEQWNQTVLELAEFCAQQNSNFNWDRFLGYIAGTNGPSGGAR